MADRRKSKKKKDSDLKNLDQNPSKEEYAVARYLKQKLPEKKTTLLGHKVEYFIASRAVDCLLESPWSKGSKKNEVYFHNRDSCVNFMTRLLEHKFFHRAKKIVVQKDPKKKKKEIEDAGAESSKEKESKKVKSKESEDKKEEKKDDKESKKVKDDKESKKVKDDKESKKVKEDKESKKGKDDKESKKEANESEKKKEKKKIKLDMHLEQIFIDGTEPYVWIYDPIPLRTWVTGTFMVIGAVLICLFPLWPQAIRHYIYYLSVAAAFFLVIILGLAVLRMVFFVLIWCVTLGEHHLWLLPNLIEDVGFFESFWPLYKYEYKGKQKKKDAAKEEKQPSPEREESHGEKEESPDKEAEKSEASSADQNQSESEQESEGDKTKAENDFEFVEADDAKTEDVEEEDRKTK